MEITNIVRMLRNGKFAGVDGVIRETLNINVMGFCSDCVSYLKSDRMLLFFYKNEKLFGTILIESFRKFIKSDRRLNWGNII